MDEETKEQAQNAAVCEAMSEKKMRPARRKPVRRTPGKKACLHSQASESLEPIPQEEIQASEAAKPQYTSEKVKADTTISVVLESSETTPSDAVDVIE